MTDVKLLGKPDSSDPTPFLSVIYLTGDFYILSVLSLTRKLIHLWSFLVINNCLDLSSSVETQCYFLPLNILLQPNQVSSYLTVTPDVTCQEHWLAAHAKQAVWHPTSYLQQTAFPSLIWSLGNAWVEFAPSPPCNHAAELSTSFSQAHFCKHLCICLTLVSSSTETHK